MSSEREVEPGPWLVGRSMRLSQDSEKGLAGINFVLEDDALLSIAVPFQALVDALMPLVGDWTSPR